MIHHDPFFPLTDITPPPEIRGLLRPWIIHEFFHHIGRDATSQGNSVCWRFLGRYHQRDEQGAWLCCDCFFVFFLSFLLSEDVVVVNWWLLHIYIYIYITSMWLVALAEEKKLQVSISNQPREVCWFKQLTDQGCFPKEQWISRIFFSGIFTPEIGGRWTIFFVEHIFLMGCFNHHQLGNGSTFVRWKKEQLQRFCWIFSFLNPKIPPHAFSGL